MVSVNVVFEFSFLKVKLDRSSSFLRLETKSPMIYMNSITMPEASSEAH